MPKKIKQKCPFCDEQILATAKECPFCCESLIKPTKSLPARRRMKFYLLIIAIICLVGLILVLQYPPVKNYVASFSRPYSVRPLCTGEDYTENYFWSRQQIVKYYRSRNEGGIVLVTCPRWWDHGDGCCGIADGTHLFSSMISCQTLENKGDQKSDGLDYECISISKPHFPLD